jgi:N-methylhydantoinase A
VVEPLGLSAVEGAWAIHDLVTTNMAGAIDVVTVQRGIDPRSFCLVGFGGAGPLHVARIADHFRIERAVVPWAAGVASAIGLCAADPTVHHVRPHLADIATADPDLLTRAFTALEHEGRLALSDGRAPDPGVGFTVVRVAEMRYRGQAYQLPVEAPPGDLGVEDVATLAKAFQERYLQAYGIVLDGPIEIVGVRTRVSRLVPKIRLASSPPPSAPARDATVDRRLAYFPGGGVAETPVFAWDRLGPGCTLEGPALVQGPDTTVVVPPSHRLTIDPHRNAVLQRTEGGRQ